MTKVAKAENQFMYLGRWVDKSTFRTFVYSKDDQKLAKSYKEYKDLITSGLWFDEKPVVSSKVRKQKNDPNS